VERPIAQIIARPYRALERELERAILDKKEATLRITASVTAMHDGGDRSHPRYRPADRAQKVQHTETAAYEGRTRRRLNKVRPSDDGADRRRRRALP
jgi:hypothetical protein